MHQAPKGFSEVFSPSNCSDWTEWQLIKERVVYLRGDIEDHMAVDYCLHLEYLARESNDMITVLITSPGGDVFPAMAIYDTLLRLRTLYGISMITEARGYAASAAAIILQGGDHRVATEHTRFLIHEVSTVKFFERERASDVEEEAIELGKVNNMLASILAERSGHSIEEIKQIWRKKDVWMSAKEALEWGLIDEVV